MMTEVTMKVPDEMSKIIAETSQSLYLEAIKEVVAKRMFSVQERLRTIRVEMNIFEKKYQKTFNEFNEQVPDTIEGHNDWIEWSYLFKLANELCKNLSKLELLLGQ